MSVYGGGKHKSTKMRKLTKTFDIMLKRVKARRDYSEH